MLIENQDYELVPNGEDSWHIRILSGDYVETIIQYGRLTVNEDTLTFDFEVITSPDLSVTDQDIGLQRIAGEILSSILEEAANGTVS